MKLVLIATTPVDLLYLNLYAAVTFEYGTNNFKLDEAITSR